MTTETTAAKPAKAVKETKAVKGQAAAPAKAAAAPKADKPAAAGRAASPAKAKEAAPKAAGKPATKQAAAPAKAPAKAPTKAPAADGRKGRPSSLDPAAKIVKGGNKVSDFVREGSVREALMNAIVGSKTVGEALGKTLPSGHTVKSVDIHFAVEQGYITLK